MAGTALIGTCETPISPLSVAASARAGQSSTRSTARVGSRQRDWGRSLRRHFPAYCRAHRCELWPGSRSRLPAAAPHGGIGFRKHAVQRHRGAKKGEENVIARAARVAPAGRPRAQHLARYLLMVGHESRKALPPAAKAPQRKVELSSARPKSAPWRCFCRLSRAWSRRWRWPQTLRRSLPHPVRQ